MSEKLPGSVSLIDKIEAKQSCKNLKFAQNTHAAKRVKEICDKEYYQMMPQNISYLIGLLKGQQIGHFAPAAGGKRKTRNHRRRYRKTRKN
jgi:hypothetical protein